MMSRLVLACWCLVVLLCAGRAFATVQRFALLVGNGFGYGPDLPLKYAESDATKVAQVLRDLGGFEPANIVLLRNENADTARRTLISLNDRIRSAQDLPNTDTLLFVYYSGHADAQALHLGPTRLDFRELAQLVRGSAATFRLLVVDACRSGALTRVKGGRIAAPFALGTSNLTSEGMAFITASSATEDAQESDEIQGSFFTHAFVSGLLGAADRDSDGNVELEEAYSYAYDSTLRATSRTFAGTQHPSFQFDVKGQGSLVLTRPGARRSQLVFPKGVDYLVMKGTERGAVMGELNATAKARSLSLPPGRYFLRGRASDHLQEGTVDLTAGELRVVDPSRLERVEYARLVRKGAGGARLSHGPQVGVVARTVLSEMPGTCLGLMTAYRLDLRAFSLRGRFDYCASTSENAVLTTHRQDFSLSFEAEHTWDFRYISPFVGAGLGLNTLLQTYDTEGSAPDRLSSAPLGFLVLGATIPLTRQLYLGGDGRLEGALIRYQPTSFAAAQLRIQAAVRSTVFAGMQF